MVIINSTILDGTGVIPFLTPLLPDIREMLLVIDRSTVQPDSVQQIRTLLEKHCPQVNVTDNMPAEPTRHDMRQLMDVLDDVFFDVVVGTGGGSVLDVAKLLSVPCHPQSPRLDVLLAGEKLTQRAQSRLAPITAGIGSEVTPNAILAIPEQSMKVDVISQVLSPGYMALLPEPITSVPTYIAASTGIDTPCHLPECFTAAVVNPVSDNAALIGLGKLLRYIQPAVNDPQDLHAKLEMLWASYYGGVVITHVGTHLARALSYPLGGKYRLPHGVVSAIPLAPYMAFVRPQMIKKFIRAWDCIPDAETTLSMEEKSHVLVTWLQALVSQLRLPNNFANLDVPLEGIASLNEATLDVKHLMNNVPCQLDLQDTQAIYRTLFPQYQFKE